MHILYVDKNTCISARSGMTLVMNNKPSLTIRHYKILITFYLETGLPIITKYINFYAFHFFVIIGSNKLGRNYRYK